MLSTTSLDFRKLFLLEFTKQILKHYSPITKVEINFKENPRYQRQEFNPYNENFRREIPKTHQGYISPMNIEQQPRKAFKPLISPIKIPEFSLPPRLQYLKPIPTQSDLNLGKLNEIFKDPYVKSIECNGPGETIVVNSPTPKTSSIILEQKDIEEIIKDFSRVSRIPVHEGIYKVAAGNLILLAAISEIVKTRFIIKRIPFNQIMY